MVRETRHLWVGNLPENIREDRIREHFKRYGPVQNVKLLPRPSAEETKGGEITMACTVAFMDIKSASKAHNANDLKIDERTLNTEYYEPPSPSVAILPSIKQANSAATGIGTLNHKVTPASSPAHGNTSPYSATSFPNGHGTDIEHNSPFTTGGTTTAPPPSRLPPPPEQVSGSNSTSIGPAYQDSTSNSIAGSARGRPSRENNRNYRATNGPTSLAGAGGTAGLGGGGGGGGNRTPSSGVGWSGFESSVRYNNSNATPPTPNQSETTGYNSTTERLEPLERRNSDSQASSTNTSTHASSRKKSRSPSPSASTSSRSQSRSHSRSSSSSSSSSTSHDTASSTSASPRMRNHHRAGSKSHRRHSQQMIAQTDDKRPLAICVRNLPLRSSDTSLKDGLFHEYKKHGKVTWVKVAGSGSDRYAIVCFKKPEDAEKALEVSYDKLFFNHKIEVEPYVICDVDESELRPYESEIDEYHPKATRTLFIGNLEKDVTASDLRKHFDQFGEIIEIDIKKQGAVTNSYAFCQYSDIASVVKAIRKMDGEHLGNNRIKLGFGKSMAYNCVWVDGISDAVTEKYLRMQFEPFGVILRCLIDREKGQALIMYEHVAQAQLAVSKMRGFMLKNAKLQVDFASRECQECFLERLEKQGHTILDRGFFEQDRRDSSSRSFESSASTRIRYDTPTRPRTSSYSSRSSVAAIQSPGTPGSMTPRGGRTRVPRDYYYDMEYVATIPTERHMSHRSYDEYSQGSAASHEDPYDLYDPHGSYILHDSPGHLDPLEYEFSHHQALVEGVPYPAQEIRHLQKERVHLIQDFQDCPSSGDELITPKKRIKLDDVSDVIIEANRDHRKVMEVRRLSESSLRHHSRRPSIDSSKYKDHSHYSPHTVGCKRRKTSDTGSSRAPLQHSHYVTTVVEHSDGSEAGGSRPGTPLCDEKPEFLQSEPRRVPRDRDGPLTLPLPKWAATVPARGSVSVAGIKGQKETVNSLASPPPQSSSSPRVSCPNSTTRPTTPVQHVPPPASPPPRPPSLLSNSSDSDAPSPGPSLEERIKSLDEKYEKWSGNRALSAAGGEALKAEGCIEKFRQRHKLLDLDLKEVQPSEIVKSVMAKRSVFDEDLKRLESVGEKYEPKEFSLFGGKMTTISTVLSSAVSTVTSAACSPTPAPVNNPTPVLVQPQPIKVSTVTCQLPKTPTMLSPTSRATVGTGISALKGLQYPFPSHPPIQMSPVPALQQAIVTTVNTPATQTAVGQPQIAAVAQPNVASSLSQPQAPSATPPSTSGAAARVANLGDNRLKPCVSNPGDVRTIPSKVTVSSCCSRASSTPAHLKTNVVNASEVSAAPTSIGGKINKSEKIANRRDSSNSNSPRADVKTRRNSDTSAKKIEEVDKHTQDISKTEDQKLAEKAKEEYDRLERETQEKERIEKERIEKEKQEKERLERERIEKKEREERESELERQRLEKERLEKERLEKERLQKEKQEKEERERKKKLEKERQEKAKLEKEKAEKEKLEKEKQEQERLELEKLKEQEEREKKEREESERKEQEKREKEEREQREKQEKERKETERKEHEKHEKEKAEKEKKREEEKERNKHKEDNHERKRDDSHHKHRENHHSEKLVKEDKNSAKESHHETNRRDSTHENSRHDKNKIHSDDKRKESIKENKDNNVHDKSKHITETKEPSKDRASVESRHMSIDFDKNKPCDSTKDSGKRKERNNSLPSTIGSKRRISSHEMIENADEKRAKFSHEHKSEKSEPKKISERRESRDSSKSDEKTKKSKHKNNVINSHESSKISSKDEKKSEEERRKDKEERHKRQKEKLKSKSKSKDKEPKEIKEHRDSKDSNESKESRESRESPSSQLSLETPPPAPADKDSYLAEFNLRPKDKVDEEKDKLKKEHREKDKIKKEMPVGFIEIKKEKEERVEDRQRKETSIKEQLNKFFEENPSKSPEEKKHQRIRRPNLSDTDSDGPIKKQHSIFDAVDDDPPYISMYDKVKARSCKNMQKQEEEKRQEKIKAKFSQLKMSRARREEKKRSTSWDEDSDSDTGLDAKPRRRKKLIDSSDDNGDRKSSKKRHDIYTDSDSSAMMRQAKSENNETTDDDVKYNKHLFKPSKSRIQSDSSEDDYSFKSKPKDQTFSDDLDTDKKLATDTSKLSETETEQNFGDTDEKPDKPASIKQELERLIKKERRNSKFQEFMSLDTQISTESHSSVSDVREKYNSSKLDNTTDEEHEMKKEKTEKREKKHKKKHKKQKDFLNDENPIKEELESVQTDSQEKSKHHDKKKDHSHSKKDKRRDKTRDGREKSKKSKKNKSEIKTDFKTEGKMENIFGSLSEDSDNASKANIEPKIEPPTNFGLDDNAQQAPIFAEKALNNKETVEIKQEPESKKDSDIKKDRDREQEKEDHRRRKEKRRREKERRLQEAAAEMAAAAADEPPDSNDNSMDFIDMGKQLEANIKDDSGSPEAVEASVENDISVIKSTETFIHNEKTSEIKKEKEERKEGKEKKKKRKKSKEERTKHHQHHHHDKHKLKSPEPSEDTTETTIETEPQVELTESKSLNQSLPLLQPPSPSRTEKHSPSSDFIVSPSTRETVPIISPIPKTPTTSKEKKREKLLSFGSEIDENVHENAVKSISAELAETKVKVEEPLAGKEESKEEVKSPVIEDKPRVVISQEETEDAVAALLGESFGSNNFDSSFTDDLTTSVVEETEPGIVEENTLDDEECRKAVQSLNAVADLDIKPDTPQSENDLQIDTDTEEQEEAMVPPEPIPATPEKIDLSKPPKTPDIQLFTPSPVIRASPIAAYRTPINLGSPPSLTPIKPVQTHMVESVKKNLNLEPTKKSLPSSSESPQKSIISETWSKDNRPFEVSKPNFVDNKLLPVVSQIPPTGPLVIKTYPAPPPLKINELNYPPLAAISKLSPHVEQKIQVLPVQPQTSAKSPTMSQLHNLPARSPVQVCKPVQEGGMLSPKSPNLHLTRMPITSVMVTKPMQSTTVINLPQPKMAQSLEPPKLVSASDPRLPEQRPRTVFQTAGAPAYSQFAPGQSPRMIVQGNIRHLPPSGLLVPSRHLTPAGYTTYVGNIPHSVYNSVPISREGQPQPPSLPGLPVVKQTIIVRPPMGGTPPRQPNLNVPNSVVHRLPAPPSSLPQHLISVSSQINLRPPPIITQAPTFTGTAPQIHGARMIPPVAESKIQASVPVMSVRQTIRVPIVNKPQVPIAQTAKIESHVVPLSSILPSPVITSNSLILEPAKLPITAVSKATASEPLNIEVSKTETANVETPKPLESPKKLAIESVTEELNKSLEKEVEESKPLPKEEIKIEAKVTESKVQLNPEIKDEKMDIKLPEKIVSKAEDKLETQKLIDTLKDNTNMSEPKDRPETLPIETSILRENLVSMDESKDDPLDTKEDDWSANKEVNIDSVIKTLCSADEMSDHEPTKEKDVIIDKPKSDESVVETKSSEESVASSKESTTEDSTNESMEVESSKAEFVLTRGSTRGRGRNGGRGRGGKIKPVVEREGIQTRRGKLKALATTPPTPTKRGGRGSRGTRTERTTKSESQSSDVYEFNDEDDFKQKERPRLVLTIKSTNTSTSNSQPTAIVKEITKDGAKEIGKETVKDVPKESICVVSSPKEVTKEASTPTSKPSVISDPKEEFTSPQNTTNTRKSRRLAEKDISKNTVDDTIEDVIKNTPQTRSAAKKIGAKLVVPNKIQNMSSPETPRKSTRGRKPRRASEATENSSSEETARDQEERAKSLGPPSPMPPSPNVKETKEKEVEKVLEVPKDKTTSKATIPASDASKEKPFEGLKAAMLRRIKGELTAAKAEPTNLIDPVTGLLIPMREAEEGKYIPLPGTQGPPNSNSNTTQAPITAATTVTSNTTNVTPSATDQAAKATTSDDINTPSVSKPSEVSTTSTSTKEAVVTSKPISEVVSVAQSIVPATTASASVISQPITVVQQQPPKTHPLKTHVLQAQASKGIVTPAPSAPTTKPATTTTSVVLQAHHPSFASSSTVASVTSQQPATAAVVSKSLTPIVASKAGCSVAQGGQVPVSQGIQIITTTVNIPPGSSQPMSPRPAMSVGGVQPSKLLVKPPTLSPQQQQLLLNQQKQYIQAQQTQVSKAPLGPANIQMVSKSLPAVGSSVPKAHQVSSPLTPAQQAQIVNNQIAHMKHQQPQPGAVKQPPGGPGVVISKTPIVRPPQSHLLHQQQVLAGQVPTLPTKNPAALGPNARLVQVPPGATTKGVMEPPKIDVNLSNVMLGRPSLSPQGPQARLPGLPGAYEASLHGEARAFLNRSRSPPPAHQNSPSPKAEGIMHFPPGPLRPPPDHYMHPTLMQYQHLLRQQIQQQHLQRAAGMDKTGEEGEEAPVGLALSGRGAAVPHSLHSPHDRATESPQMGQVYNQLPHTARLTPYSRYYDQAVAEPPPAHRPLTSHGSLAALPTDRVGLADRRLGEERGMGDRAGLAHMAPLGTPDRPLSAHLQPDRPLSGHSMASAPLMGGMSATERMAVHLEQRPGMDRPTHGMDRPGYIDRPIGTPTLPSTMGAGLGAAGNLMGAVAKHLGGDSPASQRGVQAATPPHASQVPPQAESLFMLLKQYPLKWQGLLALKNDQAAVQMYFVSGNDDVARCSLPKNTDGSTPPLRIFQRMRLEPLQVEGVARKMQMENEHCMLLALPCGKDHMDVLKQSNNLMSGFIQYLQQKQAAGIVNVAAPGTTQPPAYVVHIFPSCDFVNENLRRIAPSLLERVADIAHLLIVITTV